jgi:acyl-CoA synthetase (AMP-forming)/AMP-acid ligase II
MTADSNIASYLTAIARRQPDSVAVILARSKGRYTALTYQQLDEDSDCLARGLQQAGIGKGTRAVLMLKPGPDFFALAFALFKLGAVMVAVDPGIGIKKMGACLQQAEPQAFIGMPAAHIARTLYRWAAGTLNIMIITGGICWPGAIRLNTVRNSGTAAPSVPDGDTPARETAAILFTSGSTGDPKGVIYTHGNFIAQVRAIQSAYDIQPGEVDLACFPLFALYAPVMGMTSVIPDMDFTRPGRVNPHNIIAPITQFGVTTMFGSPALLDRVGRWGMQNGVRLPGLQRVLSAGAPVHAQILERFSKLLVDQAQIFTPYGATEALPVSSIGSREVLADTGRLTGQGRGVCVGKPVAGLELEIIRITDAALPEWRQELRVSRNTVGEIVVRGPQVTQGYYNRDTATRLARIYCADGSCYHRMGDLGYLDEQGRLWFCGRKSHRVETASGTLYPIPCEGVFNTHPAVYRSALVGIPAGTGKHPVICIELERTRHKTSRSSIRQELLELGSHYAHTSQIRDILFHNSFPVDIRHNAKIDRDKLALWAGSKTA